MCPNLPESDGVLEDEVHDAAEEDGVGDEDEDEAWLDACKVAGGVGEYGAGSGAGGVGLDAAGLRVGGGGGLGVDGASEDAR